MGNAAFLGPVDAAGTGLGALGTGGFCPIFGGAGLEPIPGGGGLGFDDALTTGFGAEMLPLALCLAVATGVGLSTATGVGLLVAAGIAGILRPAGGGGGGVDLVAGGTSSK